MSTLKRIFGIDLGTTYSCISYVDEHGKPVTVPNAENERVTPSVVFFDGATVIVGGVAKEHAVLYPNAVVEMVKRSMGDPNYLFSYEGQTYRAEEISARILRKVVADAEKALGEKITDVVITCPAYFGANQREATAKAGEIAGLTVRQIINEPTAAALAYGIDSNLDQVVLVYDLGGGTFDITMIKVERNAIVVLGVGGDHNLGGKDWDAVIINYLAEQFREQTGSGVDIRDDPETLQELSVQAERAKKTLSQREMAPLRVGHGGQTARVELTRQKFEELTSSLLERTVTLTHQMLSEAAAKGHTKFTKVLLVGGATRMPQVARRLAEVFPTVPTETYDPDEAVAKGAAIFGWKLSLGDAIRELMGEEAEKGSPISAGDAARKVDEIAGLRPGTAGQMNGMKVVNVTSKTFGIVVLRLQDRKEIVSNLICRNHPVPADVTREYPTLDDDQGTVEIRLMENAELNGTAEVEQCTELGRAELELPRGLRAGSMIRVTFRLNEQGRLEVTALEPTSAKALEMEVETAGVMSAEEVEAAKRRGLGLEDS
jgi:molecular chaperone DnaK (HSP70)